MKKVSFLILSALIMAFVLIAGCQQQEDQSQNAQDKILNLTSQEIIGKEMIFEYDLFTVDLVISSDTTLYWRDMKTSNDANERSKTIHINEHTSLVSWLEADSTFVTMYADFLKGETSAFLYRNDGRIVPITGSIMLKK